MLKTSLQLRMSQQLTMTPQLQQAIRLLQMPALELQAHIRELLESNVMLEAEEDNEATQSFESLGAAPNEMAAAQPVGEEGEGPSAQATEPEATVEVIDDAWEDRSANPSDSPWNGDDDDRQQEFTDANGESLQEHLAWQLEMAKLEPRQLAIGRAILDAINDDGYLTDPLDAIAATLKPEIVASEAEITTVLGIVQGFDPSGIAARSVSECITLQLKVLDPATPGLACALRIAESQLELLAHREMATLRRNLGCPDEEIEQALALVRGCHPRPGAQISPSKAEYVVPDVFVRRSPTGWTVEMNPATLPRVRLNQGYANLIGRTASHATMRAQLQEARWLLKSLEIRHDTLMKVARSIVERQTAFLEHGDEFMKPMILRDIAEAIGMHESTVSRVTTNKFMATQRGVFELKYFFTSSIQGADGQAAHSAEAVRHRIKTMIDAEKAEDVLSDDKLVDILRAEGIDIARRTVAKYREAMKIPSSVQRRRAKMSRM